jgi:TRAP-type C4-dicarboxylate transport system permease small subunit
LTSGLISKVIESMENGELTQLKVVYDELWRDARAMVRDMNRSIKSVFLVGFFMLWGAFMQSLSAHQVYMKILGGSSRWLDYFYLYAISLGVVVMIVGGIVTLRSYNELKKRYARLSELEKTLED